MHCIPVGMPIKKNVQVQYNFLQSPHGPSGTQGREELSRVLYMSGSGRFPREVENIDAWTELSRRIWQVNTGFPSGRIFRIFPVLVSWVKRAPEVLHAIPGRFVLFHAGLSLYDSFLVLTS